MELEQVAEKYAGNWQHFDCFCWSARDDRENPEEWAIVYTHNRDSKLLDLSNAECIEKILEDEKYEEDIVFESHSHFAVGHVDGFSLRVYKDGAITDVFRKYFDILERLEDYPVLDDENYSNKEYDCTLENIADAAWSLKNEYELPEGWEAQVYDWLWNNNDKEVENVDDTGGYPSEEGLRAAFDSLGYKSNSLERMGTNRKDDNYDD